MNRRSLALSLCCLLLLVGPSVSQAGKLLDAIRDYDLNNYALGLAYANSQNPYLGSSNSSYLYPYLTSFRHSAFTDDWLYMQSENFGVRFVPDNDWEFGLIARFQTLGPGVWDNQELDGIEDRGWALEAGPLIGWRGWPVQLLFRSYWDLPNKHSGVTQEFELSLPLQFERGFLVPEIQVSYLSDDYSDYYFSVSSAESGPGRPAYEAGAAINVWTGFAAGYELSPRWLLKATLGVEFFDDEMTDSPIIDRDKQWTAILGLAYNANVFSSRDYDDSAWNKPFEFRVGALSSAIATSLKTRDANGQLSEEIDIEELLGLPDRRTVMQLDATFRLGYYHQLQLGYFDLQRRSTKTLDRDVTIGERVFPAGSDVESDLETSLLGLSYGYSLLRDGQKELVLKAGVTYMTLDMTFTAVGDNEPAERSIEAPLPTFGLLGFLPLSEQWRIGAELDVFALDVDVYRGSMGLFSVDVERRFGESFSAGLGYTVYRLKLQSSDDDLGGELKLRYHGPRLYVGVAF